MQQSSGRASIMGGSPRGPSRRHFATRVKIPSTSLVITAICVLMLLSWRSGLFEWLSEIGWGGSVFGGGSSAAPRSNSGVAMSHQPVTAYGRLLREMDLLPASGSSEDDGAFATRAECASAYPSITEHLLRGFHLPSLDVSSDDDDDDDDGDDSSSSDVASSEVEAEVET